MNRVLVRYKVKKENAQQNIEYIQNVFKALENAKPEGLRYVSLKLEDGVSFVHIASIETESGENPLPEFAEFKVFVNNIASRCEEPPVATSVDTIGQYRVFE